jgi:hypothetical protein
MIAESQGKMDDTDESYEERIRKLAELYSLEGDDNDDTTSEGLREDFLGKLNFSESSKKRKERRHNDNFSVSSESTIDITPPSSPFNESPPDMRAKNMREFQEKVINDQMRGVPLDSRQKLYNKLNNKPKSVKDTSRIIDNDVDGIKFQGTLPPHLREMILRFGGKVDDIRRIGAQTSIYACYGCRIADGNPMAKSHSKNDELSSIFGKMIFESHEEIVYMAISKFYMEEIYVDANNNIKEDFKLLKNRDMTKEEELKNDKLVHAWPPLAVFEHFRFHKTNPYVRIVLMMIDMAAMSNRLLCSGVMVKDPFDEYNKEPIINERRFDMLLKSQLREIKLATIAPNPISNQLTKRRKIETHLQKAGEKKVPGGIYTDALRD